MSGKSAYGCKCGPPLPSLCSSALGEKPSCEKVFLTQTGMQNAAGWGQ